MRMTGMNSARLEREAEEKTAQLRLNLPLPGGTVPMRRPCRVCREPRGTVTARGPNAVVRCARCSAYAYNASAAERVTWWGRLDYQPPQSA